MTNIDRNIVALGSSPPKKKRRNIAVIVVASSLLLVAIVAISGLITEGQDNRAPTTRPTTQF